MRKKLFFENCTSYDLLKVCSFFSKEHGTCFLHSGGEFSTSEKSYLFLFPLDSFAIAEPRQREEIKNFPNIIYSENPWELLDQKITDDFWVGFLSYELGAYSDKGLKTPNEKAVIPLTYFQRCSVIIEHDHKSSRITMEIDSLSKIKEKYLEYIRQLTDLKKFIKDIPEIKKEALGESFCIDKEDKISYLNKIQNIHESICAGDVYQLNLSHEIKFKSAISPFDIFHNLIRNNPTPFSAYFYLKSMTIVSNSPERLLKKKHLDLEARPIKGTIRRGSSKKLEVISLKKLKSCPKERAELAMITDLLRNDLSKVSRLGSVQAELFKLEKYENIIHMLSVVKSKADPKFSSIEILREIFPGGSITGCPKLEAKKLIFNLEKRARNIYTGSIGYFNGDNFDFNICIRTLLFINDEVSAQLGSAIVFDSDPEKEYLETIIKGKSIFNAMNVK